ncbi:MAG: nucleotidyl transferase AbiEii/AbiGii toxin family protein [Candidatus Liptonbacteria bacterium]|nr:nucleotidyl transferase AbiEii/AbiGii toxin family protein [Candidatus Liptonbacteria bacterium]
MLKRVGLMLNKEKHQLIMGKILRDIYSDTSISSLIGFKGGTCAYFFYDLTRFSVDLDFDLFSSDLPAEALALPKPTAERRSAQAGEAVQELVYEKIGGMLGKYGEVKDNYIKRNTIFFLLSYGDADHNVKVEVNVRILAPDIREHYEMKEYLGISLLAAKKDYLFASKLAALTDRRSLAMRDIYDIWFFAENSWDINAEVLKARTGKTIKKHIADCIPVVEAVKDNEILRGLAELLPGEKEKAWVKTHLRKEAVFLLKNYQSVLK